MKLIFLLTLALGAVFGATIALVHFDVAPVLAQPSPAQKPGSLNYIVVTRPQALPGTLTAVIKQQDTFLCAADFLSNGQNILVQDAQGTPVPFFNGVLGASGSYVTFWYSPGSADWQCRWMPGGISWSATGAGASYGSLTIKCLNPPCALLSGN